MSTGKKSLKKSAKKKENMATAKKKNDIKKPIPKKTSAAAAKAKTSKAVAPAPSAKKATQAEKTDKAKAAGKLSFKKEMTRKLLDAKAKVLQEVAQKVKSESNVLKFEIGDIYDIASNERERELSLSLGDRDREKLAEIEDALEKIKESTYGECEECGEPIAENRLRALPFTRVCVECQSKNERELRIKGRFEEESGLGIMEKGEGEDEEF